MLLCGKAAQGLGLALSVDDLADQPTGEEAVPDLEVVGVGSVDLKLRRDRADDLDPGTKRVSSTSVCSTVRRRAVTPW